VWASRARPASDRLTGAESSRSARGQFTSRQVCAHLGRNDAYSLLLKADIDRASRQFTDGPSQPSYLRYASYDGPAALRSSVSMRTKSSPAVSIGPSLMIFVHSTSAMLTDR
jgi:hypothetical protein